MKNPQIQIRSFTLKANTDVRCAGYAPAEPKRWVCLTDNTTAKLDYYPSPLVSYGEKDHEVAKVKFDQSKVAFTSDAPKHMLQDVLNSEPALQLKANVLGQINSVLISASQLKEYSILPKANEFPTLSPIKVSTARQRLETFNAFEAQLQSQSFGHEVDVVAEALSEMPLAADFTVEIEVSDLSSVTRVEFLTDADFSVVWGEADLSIQETVGLDRSQKITFSPKTLQQAMDARAKGVRSFLLNVAQVLSSLSHGKPDDMELVFVRRGRDVEADYAFQLTITADAWTVSLPMLIKGKRTFQDAAGIEFFQITVPRDCRQLPQDGQCQRDVT